MIAATHQEHAALSLRRLCTLFGVGRTWYYTHPSAETVAARDNGGAAAGRLGGESQARAPGAA
jgi:hypothetical protein